MTILGFDTSTPATSACVLRGDGRPFEVAPPPARLLERPAHATELLPAVDLALRRAEVGFADLDAIAVGLGPGTFTGLRIGVATARALAKANGLPLRGVSSLAALAAGMPDGERLPLIDARRGEVYGALYEGAERRWEPFALPVADVVARLREAGSAPLAAGDGALRFHDELEAAGLAVAPPESPVHVVGAAHLCGLALSAPDAAPEQVVPDYLREPDALPR